MVTIPGSLESINGLARFTLVSGSGDIRLEDWHKEMELESKGETVQHCKQCSVE